MTTTQSRLLVLSATVFISGIGCSPSSTNLSGTQAAATPCAGFSCTSTGLPTPTSAPISLTVPTPAPLTTGATGLLTVVDQGTFNTYEGDSLSDPSQVQVNIQLNPTSDSPQVFLGTVLIRYNDLQPNGYLQLHTGTFTNGTTSAYGNNVHILTSDSSGNPTYRIFLEDLVGAIVLTLQPSGSGSGGDTGGTVDGQVWFRNFNSPAPNPLFDGYEVGGYYFPSNPRAFCWAGIITTGPYDCQNMSTPPSTGGSAPFTLLGTVQNLNINTALGI